MVSSYPWSIAVRAPCRANDSFNTAKNQMRDLVRFFEPESWFPFYESFHTKHSFSTVWKQLGQTGTGMAEEKKKGPANWWKSKSKSNMPPLDNRRFVIECLIVPLLVLLRIHLLKDILLDPIWNPSDVLRKKTRSNNLPCIEMQLILFKLCRGLE